MKTNEEWMEYFQEGNVEGFSVIYERLHQQLYCFLFRYTLEEQLSIDIVHDTFEIVQKKKHQFDSKKGTVKAYLFQIGYRLLINKLNRRSKWQSLVPFLVPITVQKLSVDEKLVIQQAIAQLSDKLRGVILLAYYEDLPQEEIAQILGVPIGTVKSRLHRAIGELKVRLKEDFHVERGDR